MGDVEMLVCVLVSGSVGCATLTKRDTVQIPIVVAQPGAWVEADGRRYDAPAVVTLASPQEPHQITVGAAGHAPLALTLTPTFRWRTMLAPLFAPVDLLAGNAWQVDPGQLDVDLARATWSLDTDYIDDPAYADARRSRRIGMGLVGGGLVAGAVGIGVMMSGVCYDACDTDTDRRMAAGAVVMGVATVAMVTGAVMWIRHRGRERRIADRYLAHGPWTASAR